MPRGEAEAKGFVVDTSCYPWFGYKGPRFNPTSAVTVLTDLEALLQDALRAASDHLDYCGYGDTYERECARDQRIEERIEHALAQDPER